MEYELVVDGLVKPVVVKLKNVKRTRLAVHTNGGVYLTAPAKISRKNILNIIESNMVWIVEKQALMLKNQVRPELAAGEIFYRGKIWRNVVTPELGRHIEIDAPGLAIYSGASLMGERLICWYKSEAAFRIPPRLRELANTHGFSYKSCKTREMRRRWGSWRADGIITINSKLILAPDMVSDAIMLHELVHTLHPNHSKSFWGALRALCQWDEAENWLKNHNNFITQKFTLDV